MPRVSKPVLATRRTRIRNWLLAHGHPTGRVTALQLRNDDELRDELLALHGVTLAEWRQAGGGAT